GWGSRGPPGGGSHRVTRVDESSVTERDLGIGWDDPGMPESRHLEWFAASIVVAIVAPVLAAAPGSDALSQPDAQSQPHAFIEVTPDTVRPGETINIVASCDD